MPKSPEQYQPAKKEINHGGVVPKELSSTPELRKQINKRMEGVEEYYGGREKARVEAWKNYKEFREKLLQRGVYCGIGLEGQVKALEFAKDGKGHPAQVSLYNMGTIDRNAWVLLSDGEIKDIADNKFAGFISEGEWMDDKRETGKKEFEPNWSAPHYVFYYGSDRKTTPEEYKEYLNDLKSKIAGIKETFSFAKENGELIKSGGGMSLIEIGKSYIVNYENAMLIVNEVGWERIYRNLDELTEASGAIDASEPGDEGNPGTLYWEGGSQGGIGGGVTKVEVNGKKYYRQI